MNISPDEYSYQQAPSNQKLGHIPGEYGLPFLGKTIAMFADPVRMFHQHYEAFGPISRISITESGLAARPAIPADVITR